ncbi:hypothetical protein [Mucilaginibacter frigoritolerans]|nr:hypothetical protein [Mucilaginibacter frigoritolerans]
MGTLAAIIFVLGLLSFSSHSFNNDENKEPNTNQYKTWKFTPKDSLTGVCSKELRLEKTMVLNYNLSIVYGTDKKSNSSIPISACSFNTGLISGTNWKPLIITVDTTSVINKLRYTVDGTVDWTLLGITLYSQTKDYNGMVFVTPSGN